MRDRGFALRDAQLRAATGGNSFFFLIGQRKCERSLKKAEAQQGQAELLAFNIAIDTRGYPKRYRAAVGAGCRAARR